MEEAHDRLHLQGRAGIESNLALNEAVVGNRTEASNEADEAPFAELSTCLVECRHAYAVLRQDQKASALADEIQRTHPNDYHRHQRGGPDDSRDRCCAPRIPPPPIPPKPSTS